jgi:hypothetical protein
MANNIIRFSVNKAEHQNNSRVSILKFVQRRSEYNNLFTHRILDLILSHSINPENRINYGLQLPVDFTIKSKPQ